MPGDGSPTFATSTSSSPACTTGTSGSGATEEYILECALADSPTSADSGSYPFTFTATGAGGVGTATSGTLTVNVAQPAPSWETDTTKLGNYDSAVKGVPFCYDIAVTTSTSGGATTGSPGSLPLTSLTAGTTPTGVTNYRIQNVNLAQGSGQLCGTNNNTAASAPVTMAPVATNSGGSATDSIALWSQNECTWTSTTPGGSTSVSMFDSNQDLEQAGSQSAFGQSITNGEKLGGLSVGTLNYPTCSGGVGVSAAGGLGSAFTTNTANPLPTPTDSNPSASQGDLASSNLNLTSSNSTSHYVGGCWGAVNILASTSTNSFGAASTYEMTLPSSWANGGDCAYGSLGSNSAGGNTDTPALSGPTGDAACPPNQADVNVGYVDCTEIVSSGNDENGSTNYSSLDLFFNGQPVPQTPTATLSGTSALAGSNVSVTGGTNWWGNPDGAPDLSPTGDDQNNSGDFYPVAAPGVYIGTSRATAVPVTDSTVSIPSNTYVCTGAESTTVGPNPCTLTVGQPTGSFTVPASLAPGTYNVYVDESNTTPLPGNGPNDSYQTTTGRNLGTVESSTPFTVTSPLSVTETALTSGYGTAGDTIDYQYVVTNSGASTLTGVGVTDSVGSTISCPSTSIAGNTSETCTGTYTVSQTDVDAGSVFDTATATDSNGDTATSSTTVPASGATESLSIAASTTSASFTAAGQTIPFSYAVQNTGTETLYSVAVSDPGVAGLSCPDSSLAPGAGETCTGTYTTTSSDVATGSVTDDATASADNQQSSPTTSSPSSVTVPLAGLSLTTSTTSTGYGAAGDTIPYSYLVTNSGTATVSNIAVTDSGVADLSCPDPSLAAAANETCTGTYTVTQHDVDAGSVTDSATASGTDPADNPVSSPSSGITTDAAYATSGASITSSTTSAGYGAAGDTIPYSYRVTNTGTRSLHAIGVTDTNGDSVSCPYTHLLPTHSVTCTGTYTTAQADVDAGSVSDTATASATDSAGNPVSGTSNTVVVEANEATSSMTLVKSTTATSFDAAGQSIPYSYVVTNTGTRTLSGIGVTDNLVSGVSCPGTPVGPGQSTTCTGSYTTTSADIDAGSVTNTATANATDSAENPVSSNSSMVTVPEQLSISSASTDSATEGEASSPFTVTASGGPTPPSISTSSALPSGMSLVDNGNGTATLAGTPACSTVGTYPLAITASDGGVAEPATDNVSLVVGAPAPADPSFTSDASASGTAGQPFSFTVSTDCVPLPTVTATGITAALDMTLTAGPPRGPTSSPATPRRRRRAPTPSPSRRRRRSTPRSSTPPRPSPWTSTWRPRSPRPPARRWSWARP